MGKIADIRIDGDQYPCDEWRSVESGQILEERWVNGFDGGLAQFSRRSDRGTYSSVYIDVTNPPYARMVTAYTTVNDVTYPNLTPLDMSYPMYGFYIESGASGNEYVYILNGRYGYKIDLDDNNALEARQDFGAGAVCGRPALYGDTWYIPLGPSVNARELTAANCADSGADTFVDAGFTASHFAAGDAGENRTTAWLTAASGNTVGFCDGTAAPSPTFEVGESTLDITDLLAWQGELLVIKPNGPWRFSSEGQAHRVQDMVDLGRKSLTPKKSGVDDPYEGSNSFVQGPNAYWVDASGLWRVTSSHIYPVGFEAEEEFTDLMVAGAPLMRDTDAWHSFAAWGRYCYATNNRGLFQGRILADGTIRWLSSMVSLPSSAALQRCVITEGKNSPLLWYVGDGTPQLLTSFALSQDGGTRADLGDARGGVGITGLVYLPQTDFGEIDKQKQLRRMWAITEGLNSDNTFKFQYTRNRGTTPADLGTAYSAAGTHEQAWTPGTNDLCYEAQMVLWLKIAGGGTPADPRVRACGIQAATPEVYRIVIPITPKELRGRNMTVAEAMKRLRNLKNSQAVAIAEPGFDATFNGYIRSTSEESFQAPNGELVHNMILFIERYDWSANA